MRNQDFYEKYMASNEWRLKRLERLKLDGFLCQTCGESEYLECHHRSYERLGNEDVENDLITLCTWCHGAITSSIRQRRYKKRVHTPDYLEKKENFDYVARKRVSLEVDLSDIVSQWTISKSGKQIRKSLEASIIETLKDRSRL